MNHPQSSESTDTSKHLPALPLTVFRFTQSENPAHFEQAASLREAVFVEEQNVPAEEEWDEYDEVATHWLLVDSENDLPVATARLIDYQEACQTRPVAKIGRVAVSAEYRGKGIGEHLMQEVLMFARASGYEQAILDAQTHALPFYQRLGFVAEGLEFMEAGIPHYSMRLVFQEA